MGNSSKTWVITLTYIDLPLLEFSLERFYTTSALSQKEHILVDHHWPIDSWNHRHGILKLAEKYGCKVMTPYQNLGSHGGFNWVLKNLPIQAGDVLITYDGDSNPVSHGWDFALVTLLKHDPSYAAASLFIDAELRTKEWTRFKTNSGFEVLSPRAGNEMINITAWNVSFLHQVKGFHAAFSYYGQIEAPMFDLMKKNSRLHGYLADYKEIPRPFNAHPEYQAWKEAHVAQGFEGNFDEWLEQRRGT